MRYPLTLPDLGLADKTCTLSVWLVEVGSEVTEGDRLVEILAEEVTVDLPAPASGKLVETLVEEDEEVVPGQLLGWIEVDEAENE